MPKLLEIRNFLDNLLDNQSYQDLAENGLQVQSLNDDIATVCLSVDSGQSVIEEAVALNSDLLICHHGLFWGGQASITGTRAQKIARLFSAGCSLYASHLPLDGHLEYGNAAQLAKFLKGSLTEQFCLYKGRYIGVTTQFESVQTIDQISNQLRLLPGAEKDPLVWRFGKSEIKSAAIVTGSGSSAINDAIRAGAELLITGEPKQEAFHAAKEAKLSVIFAGHYATETLGVRALGAALEKRFSLKTLFIDQPTGI